MIWTIDLDKTVRRDIEGEPHQLTITIANDLKKAWEIIWLGGVTGAILRNLLKQAIYKIEEVDPPSSTTFSTRGT